MNSNIKGITIELGGNTGPLGAALKDAESQSRSLQTELKEVNKQLKFDPSNTTLLQQKQDLLNQSIAETKKKLDTLKEAEKQVEQQFKAGTIGADNYRAFQREVQSTESKLKSLEKQAGLCEASLSKISAITGKVGSSLENAGKKLVPVSLAVIGAGAAAEKLGSDFIESSNKAEVAFGKSTDLVKKFSQTSLEKFGIASGSALDMAAAYGDMATSMKIPQTEAAKMSVTLVGLSGDLSSFKNINLSESSDALKAIFTGETEGLKKLGVVMTETNLKSFALSQGMKKPYDSMSETEKVTLRYNYVLSATKNAQGDFARTSDGAANSVRVASESAKEAGESFGVSLAPVVAKVAQYISSLIKGFSGLDSGTKQIILTIAGIVAVLAPALIIAGKVFNLISVVTQAMGMLKAATFAQTAVQYGLNTALLASPITWIVLGIAALVATFAILWTKCEGFRNFWINLWNGIKTVAGNVVSAVAGFFTKTIPDAFNAVLNWVKSNWQGLLLLIVNPFAGAFKLVYDNCAGFRNFINGFIDGIKNFFIGAWNWAKTFFAQWGPLILTFIAPVIGIPLLIKQHWSEIKTFFTNLWTGIISFFTTTIPQWIQSVIQWFEKLPYNLGVFIGQMLGHIVKFGIDAYTWVTTELPKIIQGIITWFSQLPGQIWGFLTDIVTKIGTWGSNVLTSATTWISNTVTAVLTFFSELPGKIWAHLTDIVGKVGTWGSNVLTTATTWISNTINSVVTFFSGLPGKIWAHLTDVVGKVKDWAGNLVTTAGTEIPKFVSSVVGFIGELPGKMLEIGKNIVKGIWDGITGTIGWIGDKIKGFCNGILDGFKSALGIHSPSTLFRDIIGKNLALGVGQGFTDKMKAVVKNMASVIPTSFDTGVKVNTALSAAYGRTEAAAGGTASGTTGTAAAMGTTFNQTVNNYSPKPLSEAESARLTRTATRQMVLSLSRG